MRTAPIAMLLVTLLFTPVAPAIEIAIPSDMTPYDWTGVPGQVSPGITFLTPATRELPANVQRGYLIGVNEAGEIVFYKQEPGFSIVLFNPENGGGRYVQSIGWPRFPEAAIVLDSGLTTLDTIPRLHPEDPSLYLDLHDLYVDDEDHIWSQWREPVTVDLSQVIDGGHPNATVLHDVIQRWDPAGNVVWEWKVEDHLDELPYIGNNDTTALYNSFVEHAVINGFSFAPDGDLILSARGMSLALRVDVPSGEIEWMFGGGSLNTFTFLGDGGGQPLDFNYQHDIRMDEEGVVTLLDNGLTHPIPRTYAREYQIDPAAQTATLTWLAYDEDDVWSSTITGSHRVLDDGHRLIGWGANSPPVTATEYDENGNIVWELAFEFDHGSGQETVNYRAVKVLDFGPAATPYLSLVKHENPAAFELVANWWGHEAEIAAYEVYVALVEGEFILHDITATGVSMLEDVVPLQPYRVRVRPVDGGGDPVGPPSNELVLVHGSSGLSLQPLVSEVPASGGTIVYGATVVNASSSSLTGLLYRTRMLLPNGNEVGPLLTVPFAMQPFQGITVHNLTQAVPGYAPTGMYTFVGEVAQAGAALWSDEFDVEKLAPALGATSATPRWIGGWTAGRLRAGDVPVRRFALPHGSSER